MATKEEEIWLHVKESDRVNDHREITLPNYYSVWIDQYIKELNFTLSRYKFAASMIAPQKNTYCLELGSNYGLGSRMLTIVGKCDGYVGVDFDKDGVEYAEKTFASNTVSFIKDDFLGKDYRDYLASGGGFSAIVSLDVIEHIPKEKEELLLKTISVNLADNGIAVIGTPNITMTPYASEGSKIGHVNLFDQERLYDFLSQVFQNVFIFGMTDEVVHTGFYPMCCYIFAVCAGKKCSE